MKTRDAIATSKKLLDENRDPSSTMHGVINRRDVAAIRALLKVAEHFENPKDDRGEALLNEVGRFVKSTGGEVLVAGGIQIWQYPNDPPFTFHVSIKCTGRKPEASA